MNVVLKAILMKLRFPTTVGSLSVEQVCDFPTDSKKGESLASLIRASKKVLKNTGEEDDDLSFLSSSVNKNEIEQLRFDVLKEIYQTKKAAEDAIDNAKEIKSHNAKIDTLIAQKQEEDLSKMSIEDLMKLRK